MDVDVTYLEMLERPSRAGVALPDGVAVVQAKNPPVRFYRFLYQAVGGEWLWTDRDKIDDRELRAIIHDPLVEVHVLWVDGCPAGYVELDLRFSPEIEIAYFGIMREYFGRGLGKLFLSWTIDEAFSRKPSRLWVHTCNLDHPAALPNYQRCGFVQYKTARVIQEP